MSSAVLHIQYVWHISMINLARHNIILFKYKIASSRDFPRNSVAKNLGHYTFNSHSSLYLRHHRVGDKIASFRNCTSTFKLLNIMICVSLNKIVPNLFFD